MLYDLVTYQIRFHRTSDSQILTLSHPLTSHSLPLSLKPKHRRRLLIDLLNSHTEQLHRDLTECLFTTIQWLSSPFFFCWVCAKFLVGFCVYASLPFWYFLFVFLVGFVLNFLLDFVFMLVFPFDLLFSFSGSLEECWRNSKWIGCWIW